MKNKERISDLETRMNVFEKFIKSQIYEDVIKNSVPPYKPEFELLPEGIKFYIVRGLFSDYSEIYFGFGNNQAICYDKEADYLVAHVNSRIANDIISQCHLEPCKIKDLRAGDWFITDIGGANFVYLFISTEKIFNINQNGIIYIIHFDRMENSRKMKVVYVH